MSDHLLKMGIKTQMDSLLIEVDSQAQFTLGGKMPEQIGIIIGISIQVEGLGPSGQQLIGADDAANLYLTFIQGSNRFWNQVRLSDLVYLPNPSDSNMTVQNARYMYVNINAQALTLDQSFIDNPTIVQDKIIMMNLWYIGTTAKIKADAAVEKIMVTQT